MKNLLPIIGILALAATGCSGAGSGFTSPASTIAAVPNTAVVAPGGVAALNKSSAVFKITVPSKLSAQSTTRHPQYVSPNTKSIKIDLTAVNGASYSGTPSVVADLLPSQTGTGNFQVSSVARKIEATYYTGGVIYTIPFAALPAASDTFVLTTYDHPQAAGNALSAGTVIAAIAVGVVANVSVTLVAVVPPVVAQKIYVTNYLGNNVTTFNTDGTASTLKVSGLSNPHGLTVDAAGKIYVVTPGAYGSVNGTVKTFNADGTASTPTIIGLNYPQAVAVDAAGKIYVANLVGNVTIYNPNGSAATPATIAASGQNSIAVDAANKIFAGTSYLLTTYNATGTQITPTIGASPYQLTMATGIAVDLAGKIYIVSTGNYMTSAALTIYDKNGVQLSSITSGVSSPAGVAVDATGKIYVANGGDNTITVFNAAGIQQTALTISGLNSPSGIAIQ